MLLLGGTGATGRGDLIGLTLWFIHERAQKKESAWWPFINTFPHTTLSPLLWTEEEQEQLLKGCPSLGIFLFSEFPASKFSISIFLQCPGTSCCCHEIIVVEFVVMVFCNYFMQQFRPQKLSGPSCSMLIVDVFLLMITIYVILKLLGCWFVSKDFQRCMIFTFRNLVMVFLFRGNQAAGHCLER